MKRLLALLLVCVGYASPASAQFAVYDVANDIRNMIAELRQYEEFIQKVQHWRRQVEGLQDELKNMTSRDIAMLLLGRVAGRDDRLGRTAINLVQRLDTNDPQWRKQAEMLLGVYYALPENSLHYYGWDIENLLDGADRLRDDVEAGYQQRAPYMDAYHFLAAQEDPSAARLSALGEVDAMLGGLGDKSELQQLQAMGAALALLAKQNEAAIDAQHMLINQQQQDLNAVMAGRTRAMQRELQRAAEASFIRQPSCGNQCMGRW